MHNWTVLDIKNNFNFKIYLLYLKLHFGYEFLYVQIIFFFFVIFFFFFLSSFIRPVSKLFSKSAGKCIREIKIKVSIKSIFKSSHTDVHFTAP